MVRWARHLEESLNFENLANIDYTGGYGGVLISCGAKGSALFSCVYFAMILLV
jgi:hypothetical protein